ncbi:PKD domain-containing protein [Gaiella sp.]|uniref:PKD domain-containing protein n=1 Tax=Gaiella sp. TaxID=2663207 RepID=UPI003983443A
MTLLISVLAVVLVGRADAVLPTDTITTFAKSSEAHGVYTSVAKFGPDFMIMSRLAGPMWVMRNGATETAAGSVGYSAGGAAASSIVVDWARGYVYYVPTGKHSVVRVAIDKTDPGAPKLKTTAVTTGSATTSGFAGDGEAGADVRFNSPRGLALGSDGTVYVADMKNNRVRFISPTGVVETFAGSGSAGSSGDGGQATSARLELPTVVAVAPDNNVLINSNAGATFFSQRFRKVAPNGVITSITPACGTSCRRLRGMTFDATGAAYLSLPHRIFKYSGGNFSSLTSLVNYSGDVGAYGGDGGEIASARLDSPGALAVDQVGSLYILSNGRVRKVRNYPPRAALSCSPMQGNAPLAITCAPTAGTFDPNGSIISYGWNFGTRLGTTTVKRVQQTHTYDTAGAKVVKLTVTDDAGVRATAEVTITVR